MMFDQLAADRVAAGGTYSGRMVSLPGGGTIGLRFFSTGGGIRGVPGATIDINIPGIAIDKVKFF
jgi:hypothetical protein